MTGELTAGLGVVAPILWDLWNSRSEITLTLRQSATLVQKEQALEKLAIQYGGKPIDALSKIVFSLENTGRTAITNEDVITPLQLSFSEAEVLEVNVGKSSPTDLGAQLEHDNKEVRIRFPLFNSGDAIEFNVLLSGKNVAYSASARIKNIKRLNVINEDDQVRIKKKPGVGVYFVGVLSLLFIAVFVSLVGEEKRKRRTLKNLASGGPPFQGNETVEAIRDFVGREMTFLTTQRKREVLEALATRSGALKEVDLVQLRKFLEDKALQESPLGGAVVSFVIASAGCWYVFSSLFG